MTAPSALTLPKGGSVAMGISVSTHDADDTVTVKISGLKAYESITDNVDATVFTGSPVILTAPRSTAG